MRVIAPRLVGWCSEVIAWTMRSIPVGASMRFFDAPWDWSRQRLHYTWRELGRKSRVYLTRPGHKMHPDDYKFIHGNAGEAKIDLSDHLINPQNHSALMKLPWELRSYIFKLVLGGNKIHLNMARIWNQEITRVEYYNCPAWLYDEDYCPHNCMFPIDRYFLAPEETVRGTNQSTALVRSCRRAYVEARQFLYTENIFSATSLTCLAELQRTFGPRRLQFLSWLEVFIDKTGLVELIDEDPNQVASNVYRNKWAMARFHRAFNKVSEMHNLRTLRVHLKLHEFAYWVSSLSEQIPSLSSKLWARGVTPLITDILSRIPSSAQCDLFVRHARENASHSIKFGRHTVHGIGE